MSKVYDLAIAVASELAEYDAQVQFFPEFALKGMQTTRVIVIPASDEYNSLSRNAHEELPVIHVGVVRRATEDDVPSLLTLVENIARSFLRRRLAGATCVSAGSSMAARMAMMAITTVTFLLYTRLSLIIVP